MFVRLRRWFRNRRHNDCCDCCCDPCGAPAHTHPEPIPAPKEGKELPKGKEVSVPSHRSLTVETKNPFELSRRYETRVGHAPDYSWLTGQLQFVHADGGLWVVRYAPLENDDLYGGSVILARDVRMDDYREGDLVTVHGQIIRDKGTVFLGGPLYQARSITLEDRASK